MDFLENISMLADYFVQLKRVGQTAATQMNYIKSLSRFITFVKLTIGASDQSVVTKCSHYLEFMGVLRKPISKSHSEDVCSRR